MRTFASSIWEMFFFNVLDDIQISSSFLKSGQMSDHFKSHVSYFNSLTNFKNQKWDMRLYNLPFVDTKLGEIGAQFRFVIVFPRPLFERWMFYIKVKEI